MSLILYKSNRLETLVERLAEDALKSPLSSPFKAEQVVVQTEGTAQWLKLELSKRQGIAANVEFPFPRAFLARLMRELLPEEVRNGAIEPEALTWRIMGRLAGLLDLPAFREIKNYLAGSDDPRRKYQLAERIAGLLDQYSVYRPEWIDAWLRGQETHDPSAHWQSALWRATLTDGLACQGKFLNELIVALRNPGCDPEHLPERVSIFGATSLPPIYLAVIETLAQRIPVHWFWLSPCREYWGDITSAREDERIQARTGEGGLDPRALHLDRGHPLLACWGKTGREFVRLITDVEGIAKEVPDFREPEAENLLGAIQSGILNLEDGEAKPAERVEVKRQDRSVQVHACHSPLRELQVLRDHLLDWFAADPTLAPENILVMLPDIEAYAPFIQGVFDSAEEGAPGIPYTLAGRGARPESPLVAAFAELLRLSASRLTSTEVMGFFEIAAVRRRFAVAEEELPQVRQWVQSAGIRWGRNANHRGQLGLPAFAEHTWEHGRDRLLLGYAMADDSDAPVDELLPCKGIEGTVTDLLGRWLDFLRRFFAALDELSLPHTLAGWASTLNRLLDELFLPDPSEEVAANTIRQIVDGLRQQQTVSAFLESVPLPVVLERILPQFEQNQSGKAFLRGRVTFSGLNSLRGVPFRMICVLGMQDGSFPRRPTPPSFDLMAQQPKTGDQSRRDDDRYLFLETLLAARDRLYLSYVGQSVRDNSLRPPSVVLSELLDYVASRFRLEGAAAEQEQNTDQPRIVRELLMTRHRLHAFSPAYFQQGSRADRRLFGYSPAHAQISRVLADRTCRVSAEPFLAAPLAEPGPEWRTVALQDLQFYYRNPARFFVEKRLEFKLPEDIELLEEAEPFSLDGLEAYSCKQEILDSLFDQRTRGKLVAVWKGSGRLPPGPTGTLLANDVFADVRPLAERVLRRVGQAERICQPVSLRIGPFTLEGQLALFPQVGLVHYRAASVDRERKPEAHLRLWLEHLALQLADTTAPTKSYLIGEDATWVFREVPNARELLADLLGLYFRGLSEPLRFFPKASFACVIGRGPGSRRTPAELAQQAWEGNEDDDFQKGEQADPYFSLCFRNAPDPLDEEFEELALRIVGPLLIHQTEEP